MKKCEAKVEIRGQGGGLRHGGGLGQDGGLQAGERLATLPYSGLTNKNMLRRAAFLFILSSFVDAFIGWKAI